MKKTTIKDIATYVGVSAMTVSYVLNSHPNQKISEETRKKILEAVELLGYIPNSAARTLRLKHTNCVTLVMEKNIRLYRYAQVLEGVRTALEKNGYHLLLCGSGGDGEIPEYINTVLENRSDGIIYVGKDGIGIKEKELIWIRNRKIPFVTLDCDEMVDISGVTYDYYQGAFDHLLYLYSIGIKFLIYLKPDWMTKQERERLRAIQNFCKQYTIVFRVYEIHYDMGNIDDIQDVNFLWDRAFHIWIEENWKNLPFIWEHEKQVAMVCSWGLWMEIVIAKSLSTHKHVHIAGFGESNLIPHLWKHTSCSLMNNYEAGNLSANYLLKQIHGNTKPLHKALTPLVGHQ